jgi:hypothetical protein
MSIESTINDLIARANADADLRARLSNDLRGTIQAETGLTVPDDWNIAITDNADGTMEIGFVNDDVPDDYLALVSGGTPNPAAGAGTSACFSGNWGSVNPHDVSIGLSPTGPQTITGQG